MVLDFCSTETQEGRLLRKLLDLRENKRVRGLSTVGPVRGSATHCTGGVGKAIALRALCYEESVKKAFPDGICVMESGEMRRTVQFRKNLSGVSEISVE